MSDSVVDSEPAPEADGDQADVSQNDTAGDPIASEVVEQAEPSVETAMPEPASPPAADQPAPSAKEVPDPLTPVEGLPPIVPHEPMMMQILGGIVTAVSNKEVELTLDDGRPAVIHRENFDLAGTDPTTVLQVGDGAEGAVLSREDPRDRVVLSRKWVQRDRAWKKAAECVDDHSTMHVKIISVSKKGVVVDVMGLRGFVPLNHFQLGAKEPSADLVGQMVELRVIAADRQKDKLLLSRRSHLLKEQRKAETEALQKLKVGSVMKGTVVDLTQFGAFVEVGEEGSEVRGLLHVSEMSWDRISSPKGQVAVGDEIDVKVIDVKVKKRRVSLSRKELIDDPLAAIEVGSIHTGKVKKLVDYGVFVDIGPAEGMVHVSELAEYRPHHPSEIVLRGDEVQVKVLKVNRAKRRIELSMRQALYPS
ncbi:MAG: S1 RNA-binding domain-containing protein [Acidimicrobiales bacterium]|nr:S1 RNA-binding domain-containing protein [Acidimicrobiales bacterium]